MFQLPDFSEVPPPESSSVKCTKCEAITTHEWIKVQPHFNDSLEPYTVDPMALLKMTKRLSMCTECGTLRLTN